MRVDECGLVQQGTAVFRFGVDVCPSFEQQVNVFAGFPPADGAKERCFAESVTCVRVTAVCQQGFQIPRFRDDSAEVNRGVAHRAEEVGVGADFQQGGHGTFVASLPPRLLQRQITKLSAPRSLPHRRLPPSSPAP